MLHRSPVVKAGFFVRLRRCVSWNRSNAAMSLGGAAAAVSSDSPPAQLSPGELWRIKQTVIGGGGGSDGGGGAAASPHCSDTWNHVQPGASSSHNHSSAGVSNITRTVYDSSNVATGTHHHHDHLASLEAVVKARRSTKIFDESRPVDPALIQRLLAATIRSPTGNNLQPWHAIVVCEDKDTINRETNNSDGINNGDCTRRREQLCQAALGQRQVATAPYTIVFAGDTEAERYAPQVLELSLENGSVGADYGPLFLRSVYYHLHGGPAQSMAVAKSILSSCYSSQTGTPLLSVPVSKYGYAWKQAMIPATTFVYLATAAGLDTCVMEGIDEEAVKRVVGLPERFTVPVLVSVGHAAPGDGFGGPRRPQSPRFSVNHLVRWGKY